MNSELGRTAKLHFSNVLGLALVLFGLNEIWLAVPVLAIIWVGLYFSPLGREIWRGRPYLLLQMLSVPVCAFPIVLAKHFAEGSIIYLSVLALIAFLLINTLAREEHEEALSGEAKSDK